MQFPLPAEGLILERIEQLAGLCLLHVVFASPSACGSLCKTPSSRVHSVYWRSLDDAPCAGQRVRLRLRVRRFRCEGIGCPRRIFAESLPEVAAPFARRTSRCSAMLLPITIALGGEAAARLLPVLGLAASPCALLRLVLKAPEPECPTPRVLGVDDWALRRGHVYGTILVDLETRRIVDLLPDRPVETLVAWFKDHPGVEIVSRDRSGSYAQAISQGAPDALQVADRWHLLKNNLEAVERTLQGERAALLAAASDPETPAPQAAPCPAAPAPLCAPDNDNEPIPEHKPYACTAREQGIYEKVQRLGAQGLSVYKISKKTGFAKGTVRKYLEAKTCPHRATRRTKIAGFSAFDEHVRRRWQEGCYDAKQLHQELQALGFEGTARTVQRYVSGWRKTEEQGAKLALVPPKPAPPSPREARWWLILPEEKLSKEQASFVQRLVAASPRVRKAQALALEFRWMVVEQDGQALPAWLKEAEASGVPAFRSFAAGLKEDLDAVAALSLPWSQGQTEGQVNKLKLVKRQGYGRASVELRRRLVA